MAALGFGGALAGSGDWVGMARRALGTFDAAVWDSGLQGLLAMVGEIVEGAPSFWIGFSWGRGDVREGLWRGDILSERRY